MISVKQLVLRMTMGVQVGRVDMYAGDTVPKGWLLCDGSAVSRTTYKGLFDIIGTKYGAGNGSTTFNLPDMRGRVGVGVSSSYALGATGGEATHTLTVTEMPSHNHNSKSLTGSIGVRRWVTGGGTVGNVVTYASGIASLGTDTVTAQSGCAASAGTSTEQSRVNINATHTHDSQGGNTAHNNMQPYMALNYIIFAGV